MRTGLWHLEGGRGGGEGDNREEQGGSVKKETPRDVMLKVGTTVKAS